MSRIIHINIPVWINTMHAEKLKFCHKSNTTLFATPEKNEKVFPLKCYVVLFSNIYVLLFLAIKSKSFCHYKMTGKERSSTRNCKKI